MGKPITSLQDLTPDRTNANKGTPRGRGMVEASLRETGAGRSIVVDKDGRIIAGNKTLEAWADIGGEIEVIRTDGKRLVVVQRDDLDLSDDTGQARKLAYYDNRAGEVGLDWDTEQLLADLNAGVDLSGMFREDELDELLAGMRDAVEPVEDVEPQIDKAEELRDAWGVESGQMWQLGDHRIVCGDSTDLQDVARLMQGGAVELVFTSPPYGQQRDYTQAIGDWLALMQGVFGNLPTRDDAQVLVNLGLVHDEGEWQPYWQEWLEWMRTHEWRRFGWYVWDQGPGLPGDWSGRLAPAFEFIFHFNKVARKPNKTKDTIWGGSENHGSGLRGKDGKVKGYTHAGQAVQERKIPDSVIRVMRHKARGIEVAHPAVFSVELAEEVISAYSSPGGVVYEPFSGSGTTIIACEQLNRRARAIEISPAYVAVALQRWADATGREPVRME